MMKKISIFICIVSIFLVGCGAKDKAVEKVIEEIDSIGTVRLSDKDAIEQALNHYSQLTDRQKEAVENYVELMEAQDKLKELEEKAKRGELVSLSALAAAVKAEHGRTPQRGGDGKKPSIRAQLKADQQQAAKTQKQDKEKKRSIKKDLEME